MPNNPNADKVYATFRLWGRDLNPDEISELLGLTPSESHRRGDSKGKDKTFPSGYWGLTSNGVESTDLEEHIDWLLQKILPVSKQLAELRSIDVNADIFCFWSSLTGHGGPVFTPEVLRSISALELNLGIDIYV